MSEGMTKGWRIASLSSVITLLAILLTRIQEQPLQPYGTAKVPFVQHGIRLRALNSFEELGSWNPMAIYAAVDGDYAPGVHLITFLWGAIFGHAAQDIVPSALCWLVLLCACIALVARRLGASQHAAVAAGLFTAVMPCVHGAATIYYYDLPFLSLVWLSVLCLLPRPGAKPLVMGVSAGLAFAAACIAKWSALPLGIPFLFGAMLVGVRGGRRQRVSTGLACLLTIVVLLALVLISSDASLQDTLRSQADSSTTEDSIFGLRTKTGDLLPRAAYLATHFITGALSPLLALSFLGLGALWLMRDRRGLPLVLLGSLGSISFATLLAADEDERFLVPAATLLALCAGLTLDRIKSPTRARKIAAVVVAIGLLVALDFHHGERAPWNAELVLFAIDAPGKDPARMRGLGAVSSIEALGWNRRDETPDPPHQLLDALAEAFADDTGSTVLITPSAEAVGVHSVWFEYRHLLARRTNNKGAATDYAKTGLLCQDYDPLAPYLVMVSGEPLPDCIDPKDWREDSLIVGDSISLTRLRRQSQRSLEQPVEAERATSPHEAPQKSPGADSAQ
jgi:hypothetical protein